ncbi:DUF4129 domain-containing protein [Halopiger goleimassiliensis]|uniref:DUF4129 domain-containing protein n=1 Tax=Halopiger goleimassiliensis TaxID=1293048 RepID=UPI000678221D|nr:DUF4129 domain-containing protein [Halopiger goleimassiliensis]
MAERDAVDEQTAGPDWGQLGLVGLLCLTLALAAVAAPGLGGIGLGGLGGDAVPGDAERISTLESEDLEGQPQESGDGFGDSPANGDADMAGSDAVAGEDGGSGGEPGDGTTTDDGTGGGHGGDDGEPSAAGAGDGEFGDGADGEAGGGEAGETGDGEFGDDGQVDGEDGEFGDGDAGDGEFDTGEDGSDDGEFGDGEPSDGAGSGESGDGEFGDGDGDGGDEGSQDEEVDLEEDSSQDESDDRIDGDSSDEDGAGQADEDGDEAETTTTYDVAFEEEPVPGAETTATVTRDGDPAEDVVVFFDDERVGTTDANGRVTGEVPYTDELEVTLRPAGTAQPALTGAGSVVADGPQFAGVSSAVQDDGNETRTTVELNAETELAVEDPIVAGTDVTIRATVADNPIPDGTVSLDGDERGTTDANGTAEITLPETAGNATIAVERGEIRAERTVTVRALSIETDAAFPLPGRSIDVEVTEGDDPVDDATVLLDGDRVDTTENGTATVALPIADAATIGATYEGATAETTVDGLYRNAAILAAVVLGLLGLVGYVLVRRFDVTRETLRSLPERIVARARWLLETVRRSVVEAIVRTADALERAGYWLADRGRDALDALARAGRWLVGLPGALADRGLAALAAVNPIRLAAALVAAIRSLFRSSGERLESLADSATGDSETETGETSAADRDVVLTLRDLWEQFVGIVRPPELRTKTPGEVGRYAVEKGFPESPVRTVVDAFRDAEYGPSPPSSDRLERVRAAVRSVADDPDGVDADPSAQVVADSEAGGDSSDAGESEREAGDPRGGEPR